MLKAMMALVVAGLMMGLVGCNEPAKKGTDATKPAMTPTTTSTATKTTAAVTSTKTTAVVTAASGKIALHVDCGAATGMTDKNGVVWLADQQYSSSSKWGWIGGENSPQHLIEGMAPLYTSEHWGMSAYRFDVPNGKYTVRLTFVETYIKITKAGERVFDVKLQGNTVLPKFDAMKEAGALGKPVTKEFKGVAVTDGKLMIEFTPINEFPAINTIEILAE
jgi:hypothetical protein